MRKSVTQQIQEPKYNQKTYRERQEYLLWDFEVSQLNSVSYPKWQDKFIHCGGYIP